MEATEIQISVTKIIRFKFVYSVERLAKWFHVDPETILADLEKYTGLASNDMILDIVLSLVNRSGTYRDVSILGTEDLEVALC